MCEDDVDQTEENEYDDGCDDAEEVLKNMAIGGLSESDSDDKNQNDAINAFDENQATIS